MAKSKYLDKVEPHLAEIEDWARKGLSDKQIAANLEISVTSLDNYQKQHPELADCLSRGKSQPNAEVENSLYKRATGYNVTLEKDFKLRRIEYDANGRKVKEYDELVTGKEEHHIPADVNAQKFYLVNRVPDRWETTPEPREGETEGGGVIILPEVQS